MAASMPGWGAGSNIFQNDFALADLLAEPGVISFDKLDPPLGKDVLSARELLERKTSNGELGSEPVVQRSGKQQIARDGDALGVVFRAHE